MFGALSPIKLALEKSTDFSDSNNASTAVKLFNSTLSSLGIPYLYLYAFKEKFFM